MLLAQNLFSLFQCLAIQLARVSVLAMASSAEKSTLNPESDNIGFSHVLS
jgi:hypothetical protein